MTEQQETAIESEKLQSRYIPHDRLFKEFFRRFLAKFMRLFYPAKSARLDFDKLRFIDKELVVNFPGQAMRITDVVAKVPVIDPDGSALRTSVDDNIIRRKTEEELIIVHIDAEANKPKPIPNRMHEYYSLLRIIYVPDEDIKGGTENIMQQLTKYRLTWWERAKVEGQQNMLIKLLGTKFKEITDEIVERIRAIEDENVLDDIATQVLFIQSLDDLALPEPT